MNDPYKYIYRCPCGTAALQTDIYDGKHTKTFECIECGESRFRLESGSKPKKWNFEINGAEIMLWPGVLYCAYRLIITGDFDYVLIASFGVTYLYLCKLSDKVEKLNKHLKNSKE